MPSPAPPRSEALGPFDLGEEPWLGDRLAVSVRPDDALNQSRDHVEAIAGGDEGLGLGHVGRFSLARREGGGDPRDLFAVWVNVSFTAHGIRMLAGEDPFSSEGVPDAFIDGAAPSADRLGDVGHNGVDHWLFGRSDQTIDAVITIQADRQKDFEVELARQQGLPASHGLTVLFEQSGATLPGARAGHEHFGFKDGI